MATQDFIQQIISGIISNPDLLGNLAQHPYSTVSEVTGQEEVSRDQVSEALAAVSLLGSGQALDFGKLAELASQMLSQNSGSAHEMAAALFGDQAATPTTSLLNNLSNVSFDGMLAGVDLSDGFGLDDVMGIAGNLLGKK